MSRGLSLPDGLVRLPALGCLPHQLIRRAQLPLTAAQDPSWRSTARGRTTAQSPLALLGGGTRLATAHVQGAEGNKPFSWTMVCSSCRMRSLQRGMSTCSA